MKNRQEKRREKKETGSGSTTLLPWTLRSPPTTHRGMKLLSWTYLFIIIQIPKFRYRGVGAHQRQGKRQEEKTSEKWEKGKGLRHRGWNTQPHFGHWCNHRGLRAEWKAEENKKQGVGPQPSYPGTFSRLLRWAGITYSEPTLFASTSPQGG